MWLLRLIKKYQQFISLTKNSLSQQLELLRKIFYRNEYSHCDMSHKSTIIVDIKTLVFTATSNIVAKLFAKALIPMTCVFCRWEKHILHQLWIFLSNMSLPKTFFSCSEPFFRTHQYGIARCWNTNLDHSRWLKKVENNWGLKTQRCKIQCPESVVELTCTRCKHSQFHIEFYT